MTGVTMSAIDFSRQELAELRDAFALFDKDGDASITRAEMVSVMRGFGQDLDESVLAPLFNEADLDGDGQLQWEEFVQLVGNLDPQYPDHRALHESLVIFLKIRGRG